MKRTNLKGILEVVSQGAFAITARLLPFIYYTIIFAVILGIAATFFSFNYLKTPGPLKEEKNIIIESGTSVVKISQQLGQENVIDLPQIFTVLVKVVASDKSLKAGEYVFSPAVSPMDVMKKIQQGDVLVRKITIPEGLMTFQVLEIINNDQSLKGDLPSDIGEGELLPETYDYLYGDARAKIVERMKDAMRTTLDELWKKKQPDLILQTKEEALVLASIIEKETGVNEERARVAAVFLNRLKKNMRLQTDPTVIYGITNGKYVLDRPLSSTDLESESEYNTYKNSGLPPYPIANPGRKSIEAALNPMSTDELYFVADGTGGHAFARNLEQHNKNVVKLRKLEKEAKN